MRTSYSALDTFQKCPQKYKFQVIDNIKAPKSADAVFGTAVHSALKFMFSRNPLYPTLNEIIERFSNIWKEAAQKIYPILSQEHITTYEESGQDILKNFFKKNPPWNFIVADLESRFEIILLDSETGANHTIAGVIDRIDKIAEDGYEIIDYKTNKTLSSQHAVDQNLQLSVYHMALLNRWPHIVSENVQVSLYFLKHGEKLFSKRTIEALEATKETILNTIREIETKTTQNNFPPIVSPLCQTCPYRKICPAWKHLYKKRSIEFPDDAALAHALQDYFAIKESERKNKNRLKELQQLIASYMASHDVDRVFDERGRFVAKRLIQRFQYDFEKIKEIFDRAGLSDKWHTILEADEKKLKIILKDLSPNIRAEIEKQKHLAKEFTAFTASLRSVRKEEI